MKYLLLIAILTGCKHMQKKCEPEKVIHICNGKVFDPNVQECLD